MPFYQLLKMFLIPPGIFILVFIVLAVYLQICSRWSKRYTGGANGLSRTLTVGAVVCWLCVVITYAISIHAVSARWLHSLEYKYPQATGTPEALLVLGGDEYGKRELVAAELYHRFKVEVLVSGHKGEAAKMAKTLLAQQVPADKIIEEPLATNTREHVKYLLPIVQSKGYKQVYMITDAYHMPRSMKNMYEPFKAAGIEVQPYASRYITPREHRAEQHEWIPYALNLEQSALAWHEYLGLLELWIRE